ncbi:MAG: hypothetical protein JJU36_07520 [Phycisphaeraceae bacterium]|nr:hypothetical protein [Phycisphaeraceae bacterium]
MITPDTMMAAPIQQLLIATANHIERLAEFVKLGGSREHELWRRWCDHEERIGRSCRIAMNPRAAEVVALCESIRLRGCTEALVRENPFKIAMSIRIYTQGGNACEDHETQD